jgi:starch-binding outer membrane protein, SusD/RagB family
MKIVNKFWVFVIGAAFMVSCTDLDTAPEGGIFTSEQKQEIVRQLPQRLEADITGMYSMMGKQYPVYGSVNNRADDFGYPMVCLSQDLNGSDMVGTDDSYNWFAVASEFSDRTYTYANPYIRWALFYNQIKAANDILSSIPDDTENQTLLYYKGQALAVRAFDYFSLVQMYQFTYKGNEDKLSVPIVTFGMTDPNNPRQTVAAVYDFILSDINAAIPLLKGYARTDKAGVDQQVAYGIRARVNLVMQNWAAAATDASAAMAGYTLLSKDAVSVPSFNSADASSWMWAILMNPSMITDQSECWPAVLCSFAGNGYAAGVGCYKMINTLLWSKIPSTDVRKGWWVDADLKSPLIDNASWPGYVGQPIGPLNIPDVKVPFFAYTNVKFNAYKSEFGNGEGASDWCIMRAEEMVLIQAEGLAMSGSVAEAKTILENYVKTYRDPSYTCTATTAAEMQNAIWLQRRVELWGEGFGFTDAMRLKKNIVRFNSRIATNSPEAFKFNLASDNGWLLLRIPQSETNSNTGIPEDANNKDGSLPVSGDGAGLTDGVTD